MVMLEMEVERTWDQGRAALEVVSWREVVRRYRMVLFEAGEEGTEQGPKGRRGFSREEVARVLAAGGELSEAQMDYAASDVLYLHALKDRMDERLTREGRMDLAQACFDFLPTRAALDLAGWPETDIFAHS